MALPLSPSILEYIRQVNITPGTASELRLEQGDIIFIRGLQAAIAAMSLTANVASDPSNPNNVDQAEPSFTLPSHEGLTGKIPSRAAATKRREVETEEGEISCERPEETPSKAELGIYREFRRQYNEFKEELHSLSIQFSSVGGSQFIVQRSKGVESTLTRLQRMIHKLVFDGENDDIQGDLRLMEEELLSFVDSVRALCISLKSFEEHHGSLLLRVALGESHIQAALSELINDNARLSRMAVSRRQKGHFQELTTVKEVRDRALQRTMSSLASGMSFITGDIHSMSPIVLLSLRSSEENSISRYLALTSIAIFFSSVSATTLQFSYEQSDTVLSQFVNGFWFSSLVFSIASAVNSLLGMTWRRSRIAPPAREPPAWLTVVFKRAPMIYLTISALCYALGLCLFAFLSQQSIVVQSIVTIFIACHISLLAVASTWFLVITTRDRIIGLPQFRHLINRYTPRLTLSDNVDTEAGNAAIQSHIMSDMHLSEGNSSVRTFQQSAGAGPSSNRIAGRRRDGIVDAGGGGVSSNPSLPYSVPQKHFTDTHRTPEQEDNRFSDSINHS